MVIVRALARALEPPTALMYWSTIFCASWAGALAAKAVRQNTAAMASLPGCMAVQIYERRWMGKVSTDFQIDPLCAERRRRTRRGAWRFFILSACLGFGRVIYFSLKAFCLL